jgi:hypothetical protein
LSPEKNISEVADGLGMKRQNVWKEVALLRDAGLIVPFHTGGRGDVWVRNPVIESVVGLSKSLRAWREEGRTAATRNERSSR